MPNNIDPNKVVWDDIGTPDLIAKHFPADAISTATKVINAESSGNPMATNKNKNKTKDSGLFQINDIHIPELTQAGIISTPQDLFVPETNVKAAAYLHSKEGFKPWSASQSRWDSQPNKIDITKVEWDSPEIPLSTVHKVGDYSGASPEKSWYQKKLNAISQNIGERNQAISGLLDKPKTPYEDMSKGINTALDAALSFATVGSSVPNIYRTAKNIAPNVTESLSKKFGISTTLGEKLKSPFVQGIETLQEKIPNWLGGIKKFREKQATEVTKAAKDFLGKYIIDPLSSDVATSNRAFSSKLYENMKGLLPTIDQQAINPQSTKQTAKALLTRYPDLFKQFQDTKTEGLIKHIIGDTADKITPKSISPIVDSFGKTIITPEKVIPTRVKFDDLWQLRDGLGDLIGKAKKKLQSGDVDKTQLSQLNALYKSVYSDIDKWSASIGKPEISQAVKTANEAYKKYVVKYDLIQRAYDNAAGAEGTGRMFSPQKFSSSLNKLILKDKQYGSFTKTEISQMTGLANILHTVRRAGQFMENPPTGNRLTIPVLGGALEGAAAHFLGATTAAGTTAVGLSITELAKFLTVTKRGQQLAMSASRIKSDSPAMEKILRVIAKEGFSMQSDNEPQQGGE